MKGGKNGVGELVFIPSIRFRRTRWEHTRVAPRVELGTCYHPFPPDAPGNALEQRRNFHLRGHASDFQVAFVDQQIDLAAHAKLWQVDPWLD